MCSREHTITCLSCELHPKKEKHKREIEEGCVGTMHISSTIKYPYTTSSQHTIRQLQSSPLQTTYCNMLKASTFTQIIHFLSLIKKVIHSRTIKGSRKSRQVPYFLYILQKFDRHKNNHHIQYRTATMSKVVRHPVEILHKS